MNQTPILSVLVTFCKQRRYIDDCLRSLIGQKTQYPFEILIAVDGEDDGSMDLLASYAARYEFIHYWKVESDPRLLSLSRASCNRLFLLEKAVGKYFITLDGDDFFCSDQRFEKGIVFLENHSEFIAHTCEWVYYNDCTKSFKTDYKREERCLSLNSYIEENLFHHVSTNMFRNIFLNGTPYPEPYFFDDTVLTSYMLTKGDFYFSAEPMHAYRIGIESIFNSKNELEKNIMACTTCAIKYKITKHGEFIKRIKNYISQIDESKESITLSLKNQILFQEIPVISSIIRLRDKIEREEKWKERKAIQEFLNEYHEDAPVLSVLVTFCRQKQYVDECLQSILMQKTQYSYEVLIAVDGEDDGTMALLSQYQARYPFIKVWKVESDARLLTLSRASSNRLFLLEKSRGKYFIILDGDDFFCSAHHFERSVSHLERHPEDIGIASSWAWYKDGSFVRQWVYPESNFTKDTFTAGEYYLSASCTVFRNDKELLLEKFADKYFFDDAVIMHFMREYGNLHVVPSVAFAQRIAQKNSMYYSQSDYVKKMTSIVVWQKIYEFCHSKYSYKRLTRFVEDILNMKNEASENFKKAIVYQNIPYAKDLIKIGCGNFVYDMFIKNKYRKMIRHGKG